MLLFMLFILIYMYIEYLVGELKRAKCPPSCITGGHFTSKPC